MLKTKWNLLKSSDFSTSKFEFTINAVKKSKVFNFTNTFFHTSDDNYSLYIQILYIQTDSWNMHFCVLKPFYERQNHFLWSDGFTVYFQASALFCGIDRGICLYYRFSDGNGFTVERTSKEGTLRFHFTWRSTKWREEKRKNYGHKKAAAGEPTAEKLIVSS